MLGTSLLLAQDAQPSRPIGVPYLQAGPLALSGSLFL